MQKAAIPKQQLKSENKIIYFLSIAILFNITQCDHKENTMLCILQKYRGQKNVLVEDQI